ncbi:LysR family transcriptional regulator [Pelosinus sp. IPA-1]|uniref:LysR family transcriptional regulator n=1 Tax=Pelosinus sp. IPA-1 TaxID=3029569 RepID=UPI0024361A49|nr:LysR family transcriptional regulator [Pelosinus sp. IPA-1]GMA99018.1 LysR family transcriptional regulator [Pelosinus sp. IPA-1]
MTLRHLLVFLRVCDEGNMTAAAEKLYIAQPSVSQAISELEKHYNVKLFERLGRKLYITMAGQKLLTYARHIVNLNNEVEEVMRNSNENSVLRVGASVTVGTYVLHEVIKKFAKDNPEAKVISTVNNTTVIEGMLQIDQLDIGLVEGRVQAQGILQTPFMTDELVLVSSTFHPFAKKARVNPADLEAMEFIVRETGSGTRELFESVMLDKGIHWQISGVYNNAETIKNAVKAGLGVSVMSRMAIQKEVERKELAIIEIESMYFKRHFNLVYHKNKYISPVLNKFIHLCIDYVT